MNIRHWALSPEKYCQQARERARLALTNPKIAKQLTTLERAYYDTFKQQQHKKTTLRSHHKDAA